MLREDHPAARPVPTAGQSLPAAVQQYEAGSGKKLKGERLGSIEDLSGRIAELQKANPQNLFAYLPLMYLRSMLTGEGKLETLMNDRYPSIRPTTVSEYVAKEGL